MNGNELNTDLEIFIAEFDKKLLKIRTDFKSLIDDPKNKELNHSILRVFHNLKSSAYSLSLPNIRRVSHLCEDIFVMLREDHFNLNDEAIGVISESIEYLDEILINLVEYGYEGKKSPYGIILNLKEFIEKYAKKSV